jgi:hypothetical protein
MDYRTIVKTVYKVSDFLSWQRNKTLILSPSFQRRSVWPLAAKSFLIDSVVKGLPIPIIFIRERTDLNRLEPQREVVDGQQRLRTLISFIDSHLLKDLDKKRDLFVVKKSHNKEIAGKTFKELDSRTQLYILNYEFSVHILSSETEDREVLQIFARMNSTGVKLNDQELRNAEYMGVFKRLVYDLAYEQLNRWRDWGIFNENDIARMLEVEDTSDLILMMINGVRGKSQPALDKLYKTHEEEFQHEREVTKRFRAVMDNIDNTLGNDLKNMEFSRRPLFHTLFTFYYERMFGLNSSLKKMKPKNIPNSVTGSIKKASDLISKGKLPDDIIKVLRGATANLDSRLVRLNILRDVHKKSAKA